MRTRVAVLAVVFVIAMMPSLARAGEPIDPNLGDTVLGKRGGVRYASDPGAYDAGSGFANVEVGCGGPRWHALGGGIASGGASASAWEAASRWYDFDDADDRGDDGWYPNGYGPAGEELTGYSICMRDAIARYPLADIADDVDSDRTGSVSCGPPTWQVTHAGAFIATSGSWVHGAWPLDDGDAGSVPDDAWNGQVHDTIGGIGGFGMYAICARGLDLNYRRTGPSPLEAGETLALRAPCGPKSHIVGGGVRVTGPAHEARVVASLPADGADVDDVPDDRWRTRVHALAGADKNVTAFAVCLRP